MITLIKYAPSYPSRRIHESPSQVYQVPAPYTGAISGVAGSGGAVVALDDPYLLLFTPALTPASLVGKTAVEVLAELDKAASVSNAPLATRWP